MTFKVKVTAGGARNAEVQVSGFLEPALPSGKLKAFQLVQFEHHALKLTSITFLLQEKLGLYLWWDEGCTDLILPLESRGKFMFDTALNSPAGWDGQMWATPFNVEARKAFLIIMDFDK